MKDIRDFLSKVQNKTLLLVFPHPDDESFSTAGLIMLSKKMGYTVTLLTLTQGGAGKVAINPNGKSLKELRVEELIGASKILGINNLIVEDYDDSKLRNRNGWSKLLKKEIIRINPGIIVTYDHTGVTGHPDHICLSLYIKKLLSENSNLKPLLLWPIASKYIQERMPDELKGLVCKPRYFANLTFSETFRKVRALLIHKSQRNNLLKYLILLFIFERKEWYYKVELRKKYPYRYIKFGI